MSSNPNLTPGPSDRSFLQGAAWLKIALLAGIIAVGSIAALIDRSDSGIDSSAISTETDPSELAKRTPIDDFTLTDAEGGKKNLSDFRGNVVILSFWASWCTPCLVELPDFAEIEDQFRDQGLRIVPVNVDEGDDGKIFARDFWKQKQFPFPTFFDSNKALARQFAVDMLPSNFVLDRQGRLVFSSFGANDWTSTETVDFLEGLLLE